MGNLSNLKKVLFPCAAVVASTLACPGFSAAKAAESVGAASEQSFPSCKDVVEKKDLTEGFSGFRQYSTSQAAALGLTPAIEASYFASYSIYSYESLRYRTCRDEAGRILQKGVALRALFEINGHGSVVRITTPFEISAKHDQQQLNGSAYVKSSGLSASEALDKPELPRDLNRTEVERFIDHFNRVLVPAMEEATWTPMVLTVPVQPKSTVTLDEIGYLAYALAAVARGWSLSEALHELPNDLGSNESARSSIRSVYVRMQVGEQAKPNEFQRKEAEKRVDLFAKPMSWTTIFGW